MKENFKKYLVELIGAFFLVFTVACTELLGIDNTVSPIVIASILMVMIYAGNSVSGGHYNPAVSLAVAIKGDLSWDQFLPYVLFQLLGSVLAVFVFNYVSVGRLGTVVPVDYELNGLFIAEFLFTFALCYVVLQTQYSKIYKNNSYYGLSIGFMVLVGIYCVEAGKFSSAAFNPTIALSDGMLSITQTTLVGTTILANLLGAICAACILRFLSGNEEE